MRTWGRIAAGGVGMVSVLALAHPALADQAVLVRGTDLPAGTGLAHVGCTSPYAASGALQPYVGQGPGTPPLGERSLGFSTGSDAAGPVAYTGSLGSVSVASVSVDAAAGTSGVVYAGYQAPADAGTSRVWFGRAPVVAPAGGWSEVSALGRTFTWTQYDATTGAVVAEGPSATVDSFVAENGDGPGLYALAFGCDGAPFNVDAFRFGAPGDVTTYDFEGLDTAFTMIGNHATVVAGETLQVVGSLWATGGATIDHATAILERRDQGAWQTVRVVDAGSRTAAIIEPPASGTYRWRFVDRPLAEGSTSSTFVIDVASSVTARAADGAVTGRVAPGVAGSVVDLRSAKGGEIVASSTTDADGAYTIGLDGVEAGAYVVVTPASATNLRGESPVVTVGGAPADEPTPSPSPSAPVPSPSAPAAPSAGPSIDTPAPSAAPSASPSAPAPDPTPSATTPAEPTPSTEPSSAQPSPSDTPPGSLTASP